MGEGLHNMGVLVSISLSCRENFCVVLFMFARVNLSNAFVCVVGL